MTLREQVPIQVQYSEIQIQTQLDHTVIERKCGFAALSSSGKASLARKIPILFAKIINLCRKLH